MRRVLARAREQLRRAEMPDRLIGTSRADELTVQAGRSARPGAAQLIRPGT
jgi:hypothetical protein